MSTPKDPLIEDEATDRTYYATGVLLDATDFVAEQTYHRGRLARALSALHGVGTASGLRVAHEPNADPAVLVESGEIAVHPGVALDPLGRLVEVTSKACIRVKRWYEGYEWQKLVRRPKSQFNVGIPDASLPAEGVVADLFLRFRVYERGWTPSMASGLYDATDAVSPARLRDGFELRLVPRVEGVPAPDGKLPSFPTGPWPMPLNGKPWPGPGGDDATRRSNLKQAILYSWHEGRTALMDSLRHTNTFLPEELLYDATLPGGKVTDPAWVFLARVVIGVTGTTDSNKRPVRSGVVVVDNEMRPFAVTVAALARWLGI
jgi:hypothetical protein